ncbi:acetyltransferase [Achromobacter xylosoxidans]
MKKPLVIFGTGDIAQLAHYYFSHDSEYEVVAFTVDAAYVKEPTFLGLPVVPFESVTQAHAPESHHMFIAVSYAKLNRVRKEKYLAARELGYALASYISSRISCLEPPAVGENCFILEDNTIQPFARVGNNVTLWSGNHIGHHSTIGDHCFIASHVVVSGGVTLGEECFVGVNATLRDHVKIGARCVIGAGALINADAEAEGVYPGPSSERSRVPSSRLKSI